jgi:hypothetical protein
MIMGVQRLAGGIACAVALTVTAWPAAAHAENRIPFEPTTQVARWFEHGARLWATLASHLPFRSMRHSTTDVLDDAEREARIADVERLSVVMQKERDASPAMLTLRCRLASLRGFETYAGAGVNRARYLEDSSLESAYWIDQARRTYGMAAEFGAAWRTGDRLEIRAEVRWLDNNGETGLMRTRTGMIEADPVVAAVRLAWRF